MAAILLIQILMKTTLIKMSQNEPKKQNTNFLGFIPFLLLSLFSISSLAETESGLCMPGMTCYSEKLSNMDSTLNQFIFFNSDEVKKEAKRVHLVSLNQGWSVGNGQKCEAFTSELGVSNLGKEVLLSLTRPATQALLKPAGDTKNFCPNFSQMSDVQMKMVYVLLLQGMSMHESSCTNGVQNHGAPNGVANGLLQLHRGHENEYLNSKECPKGASNDSKKSVRCGLGMIARQVEKDNALFSQYSYWHVLRPLDNAGTRKPTVNPKTKNIREAVQKYCQSVENEGVRNHLAVK